MTTAETAPPQHATAAASRPRSSMLAAAASFLPWIVYWILVGNADFRVAVTVAFALSVIATTMSLRLGRTAMLLRPGRTTMTLRPGSQPKVLDVGTVAAFAALLILAYATNDHFLERWLQPLSNAALFSIVGVSVLIGKPFTLQYARESVSPDIAALPGFVYINTLISWVWVLAFGIMTALSLIPPIAQGAATIRDGGATLSIVCYWVAPFTVMGVAGLFSGWFPDWFTSRLVPHAAPELTPQPPGPVSAEHAAINGVLLSAEPRDGQLDSGLSVRLTGLAEGAGACITVTQTDLMGRRFRSYARYAAGSAGTVDTTEAPLEGTWSGPDPAGPIWSMRMPEDQVPDLFVPPLGPNPVTVSAAVEGVGTLTTTVRRRAMAEGVTCKEIEDDGVVGRLYLPPGAGPHPGVAVFGGSEGGVDSQSATAAQLASRGYAALTVGYFGCQGLQDSLIDVPLERFRDGINELRAVSGDRVAALAVSKGAEGVLAAAAHLQLALRCLVLISPSHVVWQAIGDQGPAAGKSSWTLQRAPVPFLPMDGEALMPEMLRNVVWSGRRHRRHEPSLLHLKSSYSLADTDAVATAAIPAERVAAPLLLISGDADALWPSTTMATALLAARARTDDEHHHYTDAGHLIRLPNLPTQAQGTEGIAFGGTPEGLAAAQSDAGVRIFDFLQRHLAG